MKNQSSLTLVLAAFAALCLHQNALAGSTGNRAVLSAPRTIEESPWLARAAFPARNSSSHMVRPLDALPASPRAIEQFPELSRVGLPQPAVGESRVIVQDYVCPISPRTIEEFPALRWVTSRTTRQIRESLIAQRF